MKPLGISRRRIFAGQVDLAPRARDAVVRFRRVARDSGVLWACTLAIDWMLPFGVVAWWRPRVVSPERLGEQVAVILKAWGMPPSYVPITTEKILYADLRGIDAHGCAMLPFYDELRTAGNLKPEATVETVHQNESTALLDGGGGLGHVPATMAMDLAIEKCRATGVGVVTVRNSGHYGAAGAYAAMATRQGLIGLTTTSTQTRSIVPTFGKTSLLGTNPIAFGAPTRRNRVFLLDMTTAAESFGTLLTLWRRGRPIPTGLALDDRGRAVTDGRRAARHRRLLPLGSDRDRGSHKGYGLAVMVDILSALLPGVVLASPPGGRRERVGHFFLALDPARFREPSGFAEDLDDWIDTLHAVEPVDAEHPVLVPGDPEEDAFAERTVRGIPLSRSVCEGIRGVARACGAPFLLDGDDT
jgi:LDH2 family malate/lactate/ureidoglycolate dehydrogenase